MENKKKTGLRAVALIVAMVLIGIVSFTVAGEYFSTSENYKKTVEILDEKRNTVTGISTMAMAASAGVAAVPGDSTTPIANKLADLATTTMIIVVAIVLEKYLLILSGLFTFKVLVPVGCLLVIGYVLSNRKFFVKLAAKLVLFGLCFVLLVPVSTTVTHVIDETHKISVVKEMDDAEAFITELEENTKNDSLLDKFVNKFKNGVVGVKEKAEELLGNLIDAIAVLIVTSCVIPLVTLWGMLWLARTILGIEINVPTGKLKAIATRKSKENLPVKKIEHNE